MNKIPKLRFPGFSGEWVEEKLEEITTKINSGKTPLGGESVYTESGILFIRSQNVNDNVLAYDNSTFIPEEINNTMKNSIVKPSDILLNITGASLGRSCVVPSDFTIGNVNQHVCIIRLNDNYSPHFLQPILASQKGQNLFNTLQTGSGREGLNFQSIKNILLYFPSHPEQQKISSSISALDDKLQTLKNKKTLLEQYKKGVMQKIFSQELRFKDENGNEFSEWKEKTLGEVSNVKRGASPRPITSPVWFCKSSKIGWVRISDVTKSNKYLEKTEQYLSEKGVRQSRLVFKGNLIMSICATIGKPIYVNFDVCIHDGFIVFDDLQLDKEYLYYYLDMIKLNWYKYGQPGTQVNLNSEIVANEIIPVPSFAEQIKIANFLSAIDEKVTLCSTQIEKTEQYKKGLLQKMFV